MPTVQDVLEALEGIAPTSFAFDFDRVGLQVGHPLAEVSRAVVSLDRSRAAVAHARRAGAQLLLAHHPLLFQPVGEVCRVGHIGNTLYDLIEGGIAFIAAHTNWDCAPGGVNDALAHRLGLADVTPFGASAEVEMLKAAVTVPTARADAVIDAASGAGAGVVGLYTRCAFKAEGVGTFFGQEGSHPTLGAPGRVESAAESRIEMSLPASARDEVDCAIREAHPYEEPAIDFYRLVPGSGHPVGRVGWSEPARLSMFAGTVEAALGASVTAWGRPDKEIRKVAVVGGAADSEWQSARLAGADVLVTGEVKQHVALEAVETGFAMIAAGHFATEQPGCAALRDRMASAMPELEWLLFEPEPGEAGRPL